MMRSALSVPEGYLRIRDTLGNDLFSPQDVEGALGTSGMRTYLAVSRWARAGWLLRFSRGRSLAADPLVRMDRAMSSRLTPFRSNCFFPMLHRSLGEILRS